MDSQERLERVSVFVRGRLHEMAERYPSEDHDPIYRWQHTLRVAQYGEQIARAEGADVESVVIGCLLHDVAHFDPLENYKDHGRSGARLSRPFLLELGCPPAQVENICHAVAVHVDGQADFEHPYTLEASAVTDADNIDRFGAYRILQWCVPEMGDLASLAEKLRKRVVRLEEYLQNSPLETAAGRALFEVQLRRQIGVFRALVDEYELTCLPVLA